MELTYEDLQFPVYLNSHAVGTIGGIALTVSDAINAAQLVKNNVFVGGKKGTGKTQLLFDLYRNRYGKKGKVFEGRPDLKAEEIYKNINLEKLRTGLTSDEVVELAQSVHFPFVGADEINRAPEVSQNELLSVMNGYILHHGDRVNLGDGFSAGIATGNLGNGGYVGTFKIDDALMDRLHLFLDLDYWKPTDEDMARVDARREIDPRVVEAPVRDISAKIKAAYEAMKAAETPLEITIVARYLERALDYCKQFPSAEYSKDNLRESWPVICTQKSCDLRDTYCGQVKAVGERTVKAVKSLARGLQQIVKLKDPESADDPLGAIFTAMKLILPYSGVISPAYLRQEGNFNNPCLAAKNLAGSLEAEIKKEFNDGEQPGPLTMALAYAKNGRLAERLYLPRKAEWKFVQPFLAELNRRNQ